MNSGWPIKSSYPLLFALLTIGLFAAPACSRYQASPTAAAGAPAASAATSSHGAPSARKVIRRAELRIEVPSAARAQSEVTRIAEAHGGYVAGTTRDVTTHGIERVTSAVTLTLRVPADKLSIVLDRVKSLGTGSEVERISSNDATDEYVDLEARIANQRRLEEQFLQILKAAQTVTDALNVQRELANVRTEIDRMEGRRRFIDKEAALSTIELTVLTKKPLVSVSTSDFKHSALGAYSDAITVGAGLLSFGIRLAGVALPLLLLLGLPTLLLVRAARRLARRRQATLT